jgi:transglutaminase-like putative cysteine protease
MQPERLDRDQMLGLMAVLALLLAPHALRFPLWLDGTLVALFGWRVWLLLSQRRAPPGWLLVPLAVGLVAGVFASFHTVMGRSGGVAALAVLIAAKLLETRRRRDALLLVYLGYFLVVTNFLFDQSIALAVYLFAMVWAVTTLLISWHSLIGAGGRWLRFIAQAKLGGVLLLQALPVMVLLFVFFPRIEGPLWRMPQDRGAGRSGLSDSMAPGSFSSMAQSDVVAFRVSFDGKRPPQDKLYWRGPVFDDFDGVTWTQAAQENYPSPTIASSGVPVRYSITLEPHMRPWLLALDVPASVPPDTRLTDRLQLLGKPVEKRVRYELTAVTDYRVALDERPDVLKRDLALPPTGNPRARAFAAGLQSQPPRARVDAVLQLFGTQGLAYTLQPPLYGVDGIDKFVFDGRQGFCEHFAGAFAFMMRAAGVPARVVGGYQGGDENGDYLIIRQADAHAWTEVWLAGEGWVRVDPTFAVAPARIEEGLASAVPQADLPYLLRLDDNLVKRVRLALDAAVNGWNQWVVGYTPERQRQVLRRFGIDTLASSAFVAWFGGALLALVTALAGWLLWHMRPPRQDPARREWNRFCRKLARHGLVPAPAEGPRDFALRATAELPDRASGIAVVLAAYLAVRYGGDESLSRLRRVVSDFA